MKLLPVALSLCSALAELTPREVDPGAPQPEVGAPGLRFLDVGQGSALVIVGREGHAVVIDAGPPGGAEAVVHALAVHDVAVLDLWIVTHFDTDHVGGFSRALAGADNLPGTDDDLQVLERWDRGDAALPATPALVNYMDAAIPRRAVAAGERWRAPGIEIAVVPAGSAPERAAENARGLALCVTVEDLRLLAPGDLPALQVEAAAAACGAVDVLWASHHGSRTGISLEVLAQADPALVVISAGTDNQYCHPHPETLDLLHSRAMWATGLAGAGPGAECPPLAPHWGPGHHLASGDVWLSALRRGAGRAR